MKTTIHDNEPIDNAVEVILGTVSLSKTLDPSVRFKKDGEEMKIAGIYAYSGFINSFLWEIYEWKSETKTVGKFAIYLECVEPIPKKGSTPDIYKKNIINTMKRVAHSLTTPDHYYISKLIPLGLQYIDICTSPYSSKTGRENESRDISKHKRQDPSEV